MSAHAEKAGGGTGPAPIGQSGTRDVLLRLDRVGLAYGQHRALDGVSLDVFSGEVLVLMGPNGAGKSSLIRVLTGALLPDEGTLETGPGLSRSDGHGRGGIGLVPQEIALYPWLTARENCIAFARIGGAPAAAARAQAERALALTHCKEVAGVSVARLSGGYQRRVNIAAALANGPALIILDEPTVGVDLEAKRAISHLLLKLREAGTGILVVTHDFPEADLLADRVAFIDHGRVVLDGAPRDLVGARFGGRKAIEIVLSSAPDAGQTAALGRLGIAATPVPTVWQCYRETQGWDASGFAQMLAARGIGIVELSLREPGLEALYRQVIGEGEPR